MLARLAAPPHFRTPPGLRGARANPLELRSLGRALEGWRAEREPHPPSPPLSPLSPLLHGKRGPGTRTNPQSSRPRGSPDSPSEPPGRPPSRREPDGLRTRAPSPPLQPCAHSRCEQTVAMEKRVLRKESAPGPPCAPPASPEPPPSCAGSSQGAPPGPRCAAKPGHRVGRREAQGLGQRSPRMEPQWGVEAAGGPGSCGLQ